jgi:hypothetical protein
LFIGKEKKCSRCHNDDINTFRIKREGLYINVCKCKRCGFLWVSDEELLTLSKAEVKKLFIDSLRNIGK